MLKPLQHTPGALCLGLVPNVDQHGLLLCSVVALQHLVVDQALVLHVIDQPAGRDSRQKSLKHYPSQ